MSLGSCVQIWFQEGSLAGQRFFLGVTNSSYLKCANTQIWGDSNRSHRQGPHKNICPHTPSGQFQWPSKCPLPLWSIRRAVSNSPTTCLLHCPVHAALDAFFVIAAGSSGTEANTVLTPGSSNADGTLAKESPQSSAESRLGTIHHCYQMRSKGIRNPLYIVL